jgi:hypothetical protein
MAELGYANCSEQASLQAIVNIQQGNLGQPLQAGLNLSDVTDKAAARRNLGVDPASLPTVNTGPGGGFWNNGGVVMVGQ